MKEVLHRPARRRVRSPREDLRAARHEPTSGLRLARLPIDRAFHLKGMGGIVTGTLMSGRVEPGMTLTLLPEDRSVRVRSVQVHGQERKLAVAGERTSLQLTGVELEQLARGMQLVTPGAFSTSARLLVRFSLLADAPKALRGFVPIRFHLTATECVGRLRPLEPTTLEPGATGLAEIHLDRAIVAVPGDRFIARRPSPQTTLGGGVLLDPQWARPRGRRLAPALSALGASESPEGDKGGASQEALVYWVKRSGEAGTEVDELVPRLGLPAAAIRARLDELVQEQRLLATPAGAGHARRYLVPGAYERITLRARRVLSEYFKRDRLARGMPKAEAVERFLPGRAAELSDVYFDWLAKQSILSLSGDLVNLPGRESELTDTESHLARSILERYESSGLTPPSPDAVAAELGAKKQVFDGVLRYLTESGKLVRLPTGIVVARAAVERLQDELYATGWERFTVPEFKDRFGLTRKWAIPLLEHLDHIRITQRVGNARRLLPRS